MAIFLTHNKPDGVSIELRKLIGEDYDLFLVSGSKEQVEFWIECFVPAYGLLAQETTKEKDSELYTKTAFVHKSQSRELEEALFILFRGGSTVANN